MSKFSLNPKIFLYTLALSFLTACGSSLPVTGPANPPPPPSSDGGAAHPVDGLDDLSRPLVARYYRVIEKETETAREQFIDVRDFRYLPRQSRFTGFENWDVLKTPWPYKPPTDSDKWLYLSLDRNAQLTLLIPTWHEDRAPSWLNSWTRGSSSAFNETGKNIDYISFTKAFNKGEITLPAIPETEYTLLLAEANGAPSTAPGLPEGLEGKDLPQANQLCPAWLHDSWTATGPDGQLYKTWHPQIDPVYWCYYGHEHGSDPSLVGYEAAFDYIAYHNDRQNERHEGFKGFAFIEDGVGWYINVHATTGLIGRACVRFHTVVFHATDMATGEKLLELGYKGDYGTVVSNKNRDQVIQPQQSGCADQSAIQAELEAAGNEANAGPAKKELRVFSGDNDPGDYERWRGGTNRYLGMEFPGWSTGMTVDIRNPLTGCNSSNCSAASYTDTNGEQRSLHFRDLSFSYNSLLDISDGVAGDGYFYTNAYGVVTDDAAKNTVRQFIKPGFAATIDGHFVTQDAWRVLYGEGDHQSRLELEDALSSMN